MIKFFKFFERLGYLRAAGELERMGYPALAAKLKKEARIME